MIDLFGLIVPTMSGLLFLYWSWWIIPRFSGNNMGLSLITFGFRGIIGFWPLLQLGLWIFSNEISMSIKVGELVITCGCCITSYLCSIGDRYALGSRRFTVKQLRQLSNIIASLVSLCCFGIIVSLGFFLRLLGWWQSGTRIGFLISMAVLYVSMFGIMALVVEIKDRNEKKLED